MVRRSGDTLVLRRTVARFPGFSLHRPVWVSHQVVLPGLLLNVIPTYGVTLRGKPGATLELELGELVLFYPQPRAREIPVEEFQWLGQTCARMLDVVYVDMIDVVGWNRWWNDPAYVLVQRFRQERHVNQRAYKFALRINPAQPIKAEFEHDRVIYLRMDVGPLAVTDGIGTVPTEEIVDGYVNMMGAFMNLRLLVRGIGPVSLGTTSFNTEAYSGYRWLVEEILRSGRALRDRDKGTEADVPAELLDLMPSEETT